MHAALPCSLSRWRRFARDWSSSADLNGAMAGRRAIKVFIGLSSGNLASLHVGCSGGPSHVDEVVAITWP